MSVVSMSYLLEAGVHFGHQTKRWNPKMKEYIYTSREDIYIIDLNKTVEKIEEAYAALKEIAANGGKVVFVGTKKQAQEAAKENALRTDSYYVIERWLGGTLTNFRTIRKRINRLEQIEKMEENGTFEVLPKKEVLKIKKEYEKLLTYFGGIREMKKIPDAMVIVDPKKEMNAVREAHKLGIPVFGIVDTNCDPDDLDFPIPGNDDAVRAISLVLGVLGNAIAEATGKEMVDYISEDDKLEVTEKVEEEVKEEKPAKKETKKEEKKEVVEEKETKKTAKKTEKVEEEKPVKKTTKKAEKVEEEKPAKKTTKKESKVDLDSMTVAELKAMAKEKGIEGYTKLKKAELIEALK